MDEDYEALQWLTDAELVARRRDLVRQWNRILRGSARAPGDAETRAAIDRTLRLIDRIQTERLRRD